MSEHMKQILYHKARTIDIKRLGGIMTTNLTYLLAYDKTYVDYIEETIRLAVAQAMLQGVGGGMTEAALIVRDIYPMEDLLDALHNGPAEPFDHNQWIQNYWSGLATTHLVSKEKMMGSFNIYATDKNVRNDQKVIVIYGLEYVNPLRKPMAEEIQFWRGAVQLYTRYPLDFKVTSMPPHIKNVFVYDDDKGDIDSKGILLPHKAYYHNPVTIFDSPIIYKKDDIMSVRTLVPMRKFEGNYFRKDEIKLLGFVVEPIGLTVIG
jgi:hypothetical protein